MQRKQKSFDDSQTCTRAQAEGELALARRDNTNVIMLRCTDGTEDRIPLDLDALTATEVLMHGGMAGVCAARAQEKYPGKSFVLCTWLLSVVASYN